MGNFDRRKFMDSCLKMDTTMWISFVLAIITFATPAVSSEPRVVCYYTNWSVYRPGTARFNPQNINPYLCTHLIYAFGGFTKDNTLKPFDKYQDIEKGGYAKFTGLKTYNKKLKTMLAIGGWNEGSSRFSPMVAEKTRRKEFVRNAIKFLRQNHFDGLDLDWEYPAFRDGSKPKDRENYAKLVKELREEFEREAEKTGKSRLLLTMAVPAGIEYIQKGFDVKTLNQYLDWMNLLTYDYHSAFEPAVNHHAPLYPLEEPNEYSVDNDLNIDYTIKFYLEHGADPDKLVLGIPTYGRSYTLFNPDAVEIGSPADGPGEQGDATREKGYLAYYEICESLKPKERKKKSVSDDDSDEDSEEEEEEEEEQPWTVVQPNPNAMGPVAYKGNQWVGYDDVEIVRKKAEYVAENGLGGIMFWSIDNDDFRGTCHGKPYPLIEAAKESYIHRLGSTDNAIVTDKPRSATTARSTGIRRRNRLKTSTTIKPTTTTKSSNKRKSGQSISSTTPTWNINTPEPPTTPDPGSDFKCTDEGFFPHPRDCKKYFWCLDSGPSNLGIVAHQFTCPSGLYFNKAADSCDFARNVLCKKPSATTKAPATKVPSTTSTTTTTTRRPVKLSTKSSVLFRTTSTTTTTTPEPEEEEYSDEVDEDAADIDAEDPKVIKELIDLIRKVGGVEQLERQLHLSESSSRSDGAITTTPLPISKKLYQKVLERTRGKLPNNPAQSSSQNSRRGPQNAGLEPSENRDKVFRKERPQYTTINRSRSSTQQPLDEALEDEVDDAPQQLPRARAAVEEPKIATTAKPLQYVNIRRARPTVASTSDTADDTASRNALFERPASFVTVSETANNLDIAAARRENIPEYVTIRRQRPTTEEATTVQYTEAEDDSQETALEREISSPVSEIQPKYTSIIRVRPSTLPPEDLSTPEPTTVLAVQISSLLNSPSASEAEAPETTVAEATEADVTTTTTTTTSTTSAPSTAASRRPIRRRGSTTPAPAVSSQAPAISSTTQVSSRNYTFVRRRRPLQQPNEISTDSDESVEISRRIRSTTPDSREIEPKEEPRERETGFRRSRIRFQVPTDDSVPAAASPVSRGQFRPQLSRDEVLSLTPVDVDTPQKQSSSPKTERRFRGRTTVPDRVVDSEASAATVEVRPSSFIPRGRRKFISSSTTPALEQSVASEATPATRRPTFARFTPRPFGRISTTTTVAEQQEDEQEAVVTSRLPTRLPIGRPRLISSTVGPQNQPRKLPFPSRLVTTPQTLVDDTEEEDFEEKVDDISLSESAIAEKEHDEENIDFSSRTENEKEEPPKRRIVIKKLRTPISSTTESTISTEAEQISDENGKRKFRIIRRRPTSTTASLEASSISTETYSSTPTRIRKIIRKKIKPIEDEPEIIAKSIGSLNAAKDTTTEIVANYGEKSRPSTSEAPSTSTAPAPIQEKVEEVNEPEISEDQNISEEFEQKQDNKEEEMEQSLSENEKENASTELTEDENDKKPEVVIETEQKTIDISENKEELPLEETPSKEPEESRSESSTSSSTQLTFPSTRSRLPYRPPKRIFTSTTESVSSSSRTFSRKFNPGVYTSPATVEKGSEISQVRAAVTRRPFPARTFTRRPFTATARTTKKVEEEEDEEEEDEYSDEEDFDEPEEPETPLVLVPPSQLFTRKRPAEEEVNASEEDDEIEDELPNRFVPSSRRPPFKPRVINSNTFRTSSSTTELPRRPTGLQNRTAILNRFAINKPVYDTNKRIQNVPVGYSSPKPSTEKENLELASEKESNEEITTINASTDGIESTTEDEDYLTITETTTPSGSTKAVLDTTTNTVEIENATDEFDFSTDDYLEFAEGTTNLPSIQDTTTNTQAKTETQEMLNAEGTTTVSAQLNYEITTTEAAPETTSAPTPSPIVKTQYNKLFSVSRVVEVNSKLDKHRLNKKNETTLIEEGEIMVEKKPTVDKIGEVSRFSLIKIYEDEIPIYLTKLGHVYPVENPPDNLIRIDEARNARALVNFADAPRENLIASESMNEAYRHINKVTSQPKDSNTAKDEVIHVPNDDFLKYINDDKKSEKSEDEQFPQWQFVPAAYENERNRTAKMFEIITPRSMLTEPSTLPLEALFKTENPLARKVADDGNQPFVVYSASIPTQKEDANIVKLDVIKPESGRSIITFAKGQEFHGAPIAETTIKYPINVSVLPKNSESPSTSTTTTTTTPETVKTSPIVELLTTNVVSIKTTTETITTVASTTEAFTTETAPEETTTIKSPLDAKRSKFAFPRRPVIKPNVTRPSIVPRPSKKSNVTASGNHFTKPNKTSTFNLSKTRFTGNRSQNVPVDIRKKPTVKPAKTFTTTQSPKTTTERKPYFKAIRPGARPAFIPRRNSTPATTQVTGDT